MDFMASNSYRSSSRRPWQKSMDSQEFGFASTLIESMEVAPADELFFKGQLLPLQMDPRLHLVQALSSSEEGPSTRRAPCGTPYLCEDDEGIDQASPPRASMLSICREDEEISFNSCRMEGDNVDVDYRASMGKLTSADLRSLSFRSQNSGFWESGCDKDTGDSSSSSRDSNGSSQDSYFPNNPKFEMPSSTLVHRRHAKASFNIPWKSLFKKASIKAISSSSSPISRMGCSEDLSKHKGFTAPSSLNGAKEAMQPWKLDSLANNQGKGKGIPSSNDRYTSGFKSNSALCGAAKHDVGACVSTTTSKSLLSKGIEGRGGDKEEMKRKQGSAAMKEKWQGYARRLRPLYDMKKGLMGQFRMDDCGKRACEVESGNIYAATTPMQRKLSHQFALFESHKVTIQEQNRVNAHPHKGNNMLAMSSCPPSTRSSPNHSGVLAVIDAKQKSTTATATTTAPLQFAHGTKKVNTTKDTNSNKFGISAPHTNKTVKGTSNAFPSSNYSSMSTMQELHSALQSAIAHCKESNKRLDCPA